MMILGARPVDRPSQMGTESIEEVVPLLDFSIYHQNFIEFVIFQLLLVHVLL